MCNSSKSLGVYMHAQRQHTLDITVAQMYSSTSTAQSWDLVLVHMHTTSDIADVPLLNPGHTRKTTSKDCR